MRLLKGFSAVIVCLLLLVALLLATSKVDPIAWEPALNPGLMGAFLANEKLAALQHLIVDLGEGPEDVTRGPDGFFYTGFQDGRIVKFDLQGNHKEFVNTGGRPLGMQFDSFGDLIVADAFLGLISISPVAEITVLTDSVNGKKMLFVDGLDIAEDGTIWFSDASQRFDQHNFIYDFLEARPTGRLLSYSPETQVTAVHLDDLFFANGVALGPNDNFVLVNETGTGRIHRLWLNGEKRGQHDLFFDGLPGGPDNLSFNGVDTFWVALPVLRDPEVEKFSSQPLVRKLLATLPVEFLLPISTHGFVVGLDIQGNVKTTLQSNDGGFHNITSANEFDGKLFVGSIAMRSVGMLELE
jgi:sugar lactone lactonase YvrE